METRIDRKTGELSSLLGSARLLDRNGIYILDQAPQIPYIDDGVYVIFRSG